MELKQTAFLKPYIERSTELQKQAEKEGTKIKKQNVKLGNIDIIGKSIGYRMNKLGVKIVSNTKNYLKWSFRPTLRKEIQLELDNE